MKMRNGCILRKLAADVRGTSAVEYGMILALVVLAMFVALSGMAGETIRIWKNVEAESGKAHKGN